MTIYDPLTYRTVVARPGEVPDKFWAVNKLLRDMGAAGVINLVASDGEPGDTSVIWLDVAAPEIEGGVPKAHNGTSWTALTKQLFLAHLGGSAGVANGDYGDIVVSGGGAVWTIDAAVLSGLAPAVHTHAIAQVTGLQAALDNKLDDSQATVFGLSLLDDADAIAGRATLGLGTLATQSGTFSGTSSGTNTGDVTLAGVPNYITIVGQVITRALINLASHVTGRLPFANITAAATASKLLGRGSASAGDFEEITLGAGLSMTGTTLNAAGGGGGDMLLGTVQTNTALKTFNDATLGLRNVANTFTALFTNTNTAARTYTLKDANGTLAFTSDITGTNSGTNTGDVTLSGVPNYITIAGQVITRALVDLAAHVTGKLPLANMADVATGTVFYRKTAAAGAPEVQTLATLKTDLGLIGTNTGDQTITLTGPVTGTGSGSFATTITSLAVTTGTIADNAVQMAKLEDAAPYTLLMRNSGTTGDPAYVKISALLDRAAFGAGDKIMIEESTGELRKIDFLDLPGASAGLANAYGVITDGTTSGVAVGGDTFKLRAGAGLAIAVQNNDATHGDNALYSVDPRRSPIVDTDFITTNTVNGPYQITAISAGTFNTAPVAGVVTANHPGVVRLVSSTTANSGVMVMAGQTGVAAGALVLLSGGEQFDIVFRTPAALTNLTYRIGFLDTITSAVPTDGVFLEMPATGAIIGRTLNNTAGNNSATLATLAVNTWYHARIIINAAAASADFFIYSDAGALLGTANIGGANIPVVSGRELGIGGVFTSAGVAAADIVSLDYMSASFPGRALVRGALA
jgi:hypothetical protein